MVKQILEEDVEKLRRISKRLYTEQGLKPGEMKDLAERIGLIIENIEYIERLSKHDHSKHGG